MPGRHGTLDPRPVTGLGRAWAGPEKKNSGPALALALVHEGQGRAWAQALEGPALALEGPELKDLGPLKGRAWAQALEGPALKGLGPGP